MDLKINKRYKRTGVSGRFKTQTGDIVKITNMDADGMSFVREKDLYYSLHLDTHNFKQEFGLVVKKINLQGIL